jgi:hypothetical protein
VLGMTRDVQKLAGREIDADLDSKARIALEPAIAHS